MVLKRFVHIRNVAQIGDPQFLTVFMCPLDSNKNLLSKVMKIRNIYIYILTIFSKLSCPNTPKLNNSPEQGG